MRDFRDAKAMAQTLRAALAAKGVKITVGESLELIAKAFGAADWNTLAAAIKTAETEAADEPSPAGPSLDDDAQLDRVAVAIGWPNWGAIVAALRTLLPRGAPRDDDAGAGDAFAVAASPDRDERGVLPLRRALSAERAQPRTGTTFSTEMAKSLHRAVGLATERKHGYTTIEHMLLALLDDPDALAVMAACQVDLGALRRMLVEHVDDDLRELTETGDRENPAPTAGFHRVVQRSVVHVQSAGRPEVTGANLLVAIFSERESHACAFLLGQKMNRRDAVNFIARGVRKGGAAA